MVYSILKIGTGIAVEIGVGTMVAEATTKLIPEAASKVTKVCCYAGGAAVAGVAGKAAHEYSDNFFETTRTAIKLSKELRKERKQMKKEEKEKVQRFKEILNEKVN